MGRARLQMELIAKEKARNATFKKRNENLKKKLHELTALCDVSACMIIYGPKQEKGDVDVEPEIWPQNVDEVKRLVEIYESKRKESGNNAYGLTEFYRDRKKRIDYELAKLRKKNMEALYPTKNVLEFIKYMNEAQLRAFAASLNAKAEYVKARIQFLKKSKDDADTKHLIEMARARRILEQQSQCCYSSGPGFVQRGFDHLESMYPQPISSLKPIDHMAHMPLHQHPTNLDDDHHNNSLMIVPVNVENDHFLGFGGGSSSGNFEHMLYNNQVFYQPTNTGLEPLDQYGVMNPSMNFYSSGLEPLDQYYYEPQPLQILPPLQDVAPPYVEMPPPLQFPAATMESHFDQGGFVDQYLVKKHSIFKKNVDYIELD